MIKLRGGAQIVRTQYLAGFQGKSYPTVPCVSEKSEATFDGTIGDLATKYADDTRLRKTLFNDVKACPKCGKPCAFTLVSCNACGTSLTEVAITQSENVFTAFLLGVKRAEKGFPYVMSLRRETDDVLIFDDMLALTPCHFNCISKNYIPDWRYLLTDPPRALRLLDTMEAECWTATQHFLGNSAFRSQVIKPGMSVDDMRGKVIKSFNFPPSQYQLHIQWLVPPMLPFQHHMAEIRNHFHEDRAFPMSYVRKVLELDIPYAVEKDTPIQDIVAFYDSKGVNYKQIWTDFYAKALEDSVECSNWDPNDFQYLVEDGKVHHFSGPLTAGGPLRKGQVVEGLNPVDVQKKDCAALQNYGRPYDEQGKTWGTYIKHPLLPMVGPGGYQEWPGVFEVEGAWARLTHRLTNYFSCVLRIGS